jgi:hypothetical protein
MQDKARDNKTREVKARQDEGVRLEEQSRAEQSVIKWAV